MKRLTDLVPCQNCSLAACQYRRTPYARALKRPEVDASTGADDEATAEELPPVVSLDHAAKYEVNVKALRRWSDERLKLAVHEDGSVEASFRYEGTTCRNMGRTILFDYLVRLGPRAEGYPIREQQCGPAPGDEGHTFMCRYMTNAEHLMVAIDHEKPLLGQPLTDVLAWARTKGVTAGCYCEPASRKHKWGLVLETIHYALVQREMREAAAVPAAVGV